MSRVFGHIDGIGVGMAFPDRRSLAAVGVHRPVQAGISGSESEGADSIVLSGGYEDDLDLGDVIVYTGQGGRDPGSGQQVANQELRRGNLALSRNIAYGLPVRVVRGPDPSSRYAPDAGYRYDGLYRVDDSWSERGKSGFQVWRFRLEALEAFLPPEGPAEVEHMAPPRVPQTVQRIVRDTAVSRKVKQIHHFACQVCGVRLEGTAGPYAEAAHIQPLGEPHNGPDVLDNLLCLCPNHHVLFDLGAFTIADDLSLLGLSGRLRTVDAHRIDVRFLRYHREHYGNLLRKD